jgi:hypothetical protein
VRDTRARLEEVRTFFGWDEADAAAQAGGTPARSETLQAGALRP